MKLRKLEKGLKEWKKNRLTPEQLLAQIEREKEVLSTKMRQTTLQGAGFGAVSLAITQQSNVSSPSDSRTSSPERSFDASFGYDTLQAQHRARLSKQHAKELDRNFERYCPQVARKILIKDNLEIASKQLAV